MGQQYRSKKLKKDWLVVAGKKTELSFVFSMCAHVAERGTEVDDCLGLEWKRCLVGGWKG